MTTPAAIASDATLFADPGVFTGLLDREFKPRGDQQREAVEAAVRTLAEQALGNTVTMSDDAYASIEAIIAEIDRKLTTQINLILHHEDFQQLESAWRGLDHLVSNTETDSMLKIRFMDVSKTEMRRTLRRFKGVAWDQSPLFKRLYEEEYGQLGGEPYGCLVADYHFDHTPPDVELLSALAKIAAAAHAPFIAGAAPSHLQMDSWQELANPRDLAKITGNLEHVAWNSLRATEDARYVGLCMPRFLARLLYGAKTNPVDEFNFEEDTQGADHKHYVWNNAAYAMAVNINRSFKLYGWCTMIRGVESGGTVENLPCHTFPTDDGGVDMKCPTEIAISDRREAELAKAGFIPLIHRKGNEACPCGDSLEYDAEYAVMQAQLAPQSDVQYGSFSSRPEAPDWAEIERAARRLLLRSKDIAVLVWFTRARCRLAGARGLLEGLLTLQAVLQAYPEQVHPQVVLEGVSDPAVRANALAGLCDPDGLLGDVRDVVISAGTAFRLTVRDVERAFAVPRPPYAAEPEGVKLQLADLHLKGDPSLRALLTCGNALLDIDRWSQSALGDGAPDLGNLMKLLGRLTSFAASSPRVEKLQVEEVDSNGESQRSQARLLDTLPPPVRPDDELVRGALVLPSPLATHAHLAQEREQIRALLQHIRRWVEQHEPSSPITLLLKQADRMWGRRFSEVAHMIPPDLMQAWDRDD